jgi:uncharacterized iron-regulated membrane protein
VSPLYDFLMDRVAPGWRKRAEAQDPIWSFMERTIVAVTAFITCFFGSRYALALHFRLHPEDRAHFSSPDAQLPIAAFVGALLTLFLLFCIFGITLNSVEGLILWARRRAETGSDSTPGLTIAAANRGLVKAGVVLAMLAIPMDLYALLTSWSPT